MTDPADWSTEDLFATLRNLEYFLDRCLDGDHADAPDLDAELMEAFRVLAADTATTIPALATLADANRLLTQRFAARDGDSLARLPAETCVRTGMAIARRAGRRRRMAMHGTGAVVGLFRSGGGVPKLGVDRVDIDWRGVDGDVQAHRQHHGRAFQAVCLWSKEVIDQLRAEGHPVQPGNAGENITVAGLDWPAIRPGTRLGLGTAVLEVSSYATPCRQIARWFSGRQFIRIDEDANPGSARVYAWVLKPGAVGVGDVVVVEPTFTAEGEHGR